MNNNYKRYIRKENKMPLSSNISTLLKEQKKTQADLAFALAVERSTVNRWVKGLTKPSSKQIQKIAKYLCVSPELLESESISGHAVYPHNIFEIGKIKSAFFTHSEKSFLRLAFSKSHTDKKIICLVPGFARSSKTCDSRFSGSQISIGTPIKFILSIAILNTCLDSRNSI